MRLSVKNYGIVRAYFGQCNKITNRNDFKHDTKIEFGNKILYMFYDLDFIINNFEKDFTYNSFLEIKEMTS